MLATELKDFAEMASAHQQRLVLEIRRGVAAVERGVDELEERTHSLASLMLHLDPASDPAVQADLERLTKYHRAWKLLNDG